MRQAVTLILKHKTKNLYLSVSRKTNHSIFGLSGGKVDDGETLEEAIIREVKEETNLTINPNLLILLDSREYGISEDTSYEQNCFTTVNGDDYEGKIFSDEEALENGEGLVRWLKKEELEASKFFGEYNKEMFQLITNEF